MSKNELSYYDGIVEGRLIENGFIPVNSKGLFVQRKGSELFLINKEGEEYTLSLVEDDGERLEELGLEEYCSDLLNGEESFQEFNVTGYIHDVLAVYKLLQQVKP